MDEDIKFDVEKKGDDLHEEIKIHDKGGRDYFLPASILVAGIMISGSIIYLVGTKNVPAGTGTIPTPPSAAGGVPQISARDVVLGDIKAPVTFFEYGDYQCPFCGRFFQQIEPSLRDEYVKTGKVKMVFKSFQFLGPESLAAAEAAECAKDQSKFWGYHDALYTAEIADGKESNGNLNRELFMKIAGNLGMDTAAFANCIDTKKYAAQVQQDIADGQAVGVNSTPTSFVNGQMLQGALPYAQFKAVIDGILNSK
jgi:protein-disulfide isomerase